jgi:hypothetical protein
MPLIAIVVVAAAFAISAIVLEAPPRSVSAYCKTYRQQNAVLAHAVGDTYSAAVFSHHSNNPQDFISAFTSLDEVAPSSIEPDVRTLKNLFQTIKGAPQKGFSASLGAVGADNSVKNWTVKNCGLQ